MINSKHDFICVVVSRESKIKSFDLSTLAKNYGGKVLGPARKFYSISTDTRTLTRGDLFFIALVGEHYDAHDYLQEALDKGAEGLVIVDKEHSLSVEDVPIWLVEDTTKAIGHSTLLNASF